ncbi:NAD(P)/FAD-dependent oxidoreductase [Mycoplasma sp. P36-A1]|uniref:NAD(P)/FAD-dependent oxidoreductase n=1 Tax=Mycoplasma sp. P36-A1 TaxID=3252900 RepID=UPI003C2D580C
MYDYIIIGAGVVGSFIAKELSQYDVKTLVLDKENDIANGTSMANSAIIHSGYDPEPNTLMAKLNVVGNQMYPELCKYYDVDFSPIGSITIAFDDAGVEKIKELAERAVINKVETRILSSEEILEKEPHVKKDAKLGLFAPTAGIVYPWQMCLALMDHAISNGVELRLNQEVIKIEKIEQGFLITTKDNQYQTKNIINCAGVYGAKIQGMLEKPQYDIRPRKGEYYVLTRGNFEYVNHVIFPLPTERGKGVLAVPISEREILVGPTSDYVDSFDDLSTTAEKLAYLKEEILHTMNDMPVDRIMRSFAGLRATSEKHDFDISASKENKGLYNVIGIESPGLASSPAIAKYVSKIAQFEKLPKKTDFKEYQATTRIRNLKMPERIEKIPENNLYGNIVCRCENISEQEIVEAIHGNVGSISVKGIKKRVRPGSGQCQGGFCEGHIVKIIAREKGIDEMDVKYDNDKSPILVSLSKEEYR